MLFELFTLYVDCVTVQISRLLGQDELLVEHLDESTSIGNFSLFNGYLLFDLSILLTELLDQNAVLFVLVTKFLDDTLRAEMRLNKSFILLTHP